MAAKLLEITETDEAGNVTATYVASPTDTKGTCRIDVIQPTAKAPWQRVLDVFLPAGYPHSVTDDYLEYQIYDSLQAFSSSIAGMLSNRAVLSSVGVGDSTASPTAALLLSVLQESAGRLATIFFADRYGTALEPECKMYRLLADILNDFAFILDCLSPAFPKAIRVVILSFSSVLRALCGVAAGSAKASLSAHFAKWGNLGELNAKDSSQETVISLMGMLAGSMVVSWVTTPLTTWSVLLALLAIHLETNRRAVRAVSMRTLNRQRATLVYNHLKRGHVPTPVEVSREERIFEWDGVLRDGKDGVVGYCTVGPSIVSPFRAVAFQRGGRTHSMLMDHRWLSTSLGDTPCSLLIPNYSLPVQVYLVLGKQATSIDILQGWWQALVYADNRQSDGSRKYITDASDDKVTEYLSASAKTARQLVENYRIRLTEAGWDLSSGALETRSSSRITINSL